MATAIGSLVQQLDLTMAEFPTLRRAMILRNLATLFADYAPRLGSEHIHAFDMVMLHVARTMDEADRSELSRRISSIANAPPKLIRDLAFDPTEAVAIPALERATVLTDDDLVAIARACGQPQLLALTRRRTLVELVTDIIVERGNAEISRALARNLGAKLSLEGYTRLVGRSLSDPELAASLGKRGDVPTMLMPKMQISSGSPFIGIETSATIPDPALFAAEVFVGGQARRGEITEAVLVGWLDSGRETEALVALARLAGVPSRTAIEAYHASSYEPLLYLVRSVRFGWKILKLFMATKSERETPPEVMRGMMEAFQALSVTTAQRVVRMNAARSRIDTQHD
ncbi:DUF2336 domain-containing protein [Methylobacterium marchantiae]|uniref:DUF2336 domain-containing protein n=1 Tax=Methylobacterium marchantiae TaxID=600331 RepID=A0ABW3X1X9_9HYPH|nr:hypothetical protein AIGOOFII_2310 [Methylobacterium marchantiae]